MIDGPASGVGSTPPPSSRCMSRSIRLRPWQQAALERLDAHEGADFLAVATPGAGKTTFALTAARRYLAEHPGRRLVVVTPTAHLKSQWAAAALALDLHLDVSWVPAEGPPAGDMHGLVTTYQQVATSAGRLRHVARDAFVVLDEVHHAADDRAWGDALRAAFDDAGRRLSLSGTPFRSDTNAIPFVQYQLDEARADFEYGYGDALSDGRVVRPVYFPRVDGHMEWTAPDGSLHAATFDDPLDRVLAGQRLRTALSVEGEWLPAVLWRAHQQLMDIRRTQPDAGGLVIAVDREHARGVAAILRDRIGTEAVVVTSEDPMASGRIARYAAGSSPWIVAVRMVSEGVDIPRLRVGVLATTTTTELFFRQAVGRLVRWRPGSRRQPAFMFIPDDARLRACAFQIADQRRHSLRKEQRPEQPADLEELAPPLDGDGEEQLSLFAAISAVALGEPEVPAWEADAPEETDDDEVDLSVELALPPPPPLRVQHHGEPGVARHEHKRRLRARNAELARDIARRSGLAHAHVNTELNRMAGVRRVTEATVEQLDLRARCADGWLQRLASSRPA
jgi:superfamily II DNA or RNA helicase